MSEREVEEALGEFDRKLTARLELERALKLKAGHDRADDAWTVLKMLR